MVLMTNQPLLREEAADVIRLFYSLTPISFAQPGHPGGEEDTVSLIVDEADGCWTMTARLFEDGAPVGEAIRRCAAAPRQEDVAYKRSMRRQAKLTLYDLLCRHSGRTPPWGSLTGIRPTALYRQLLTEQPTAEAALGYMVHEMGVSPAKAELVRRIADAQRGLIAFGSPDEADVYIGIPFCRTRCLYCSFISVDLSRQPQWVDDYVDALCREIERGGALLRTLGKRVRALYVGGGTPTAIGRQRLDRVLGEAVSHLGAPREFTVEAGRPDTVDEAMLAMIRGHGVGRISINPQSFNEGTLCRVGRAHTVEDVHRALLQSRAAGFPVVNMDLILGLPGETYQDMAHSLRCAAELPVENLTVHTLAVKRASDLRRCLDETPLPPAQAVEAAVDLSRQTALSLGMAPYYLYRQKYMAGNLENVGYALPGTACLYNIDIMEETHPVLALGAGAVSKRMFYDIHFHERCANPKGVPDYIARIADIMDKKDAFFMRPGPAGRKAGNPGGTFGDEG